MNIRIIQAVLDVFDHYGEMIRFDQERFENALNDEVPDLIEERYLIVLGMTLGVFDAMIFDDDLNRCRYIDYLKEECDLNEEDALFIVAVYEAILNQVGYYFEIGNMDFLLNKAYEINDLYQIHMIAKSYFDGFGVKQDFEKAFGIYSYLYSQGDSRSAYYLGYMYEWGYGVEKNIEKAVMYYLSGEDDLCYYQMGKMYLLGKYFQQDDEAALDYFSKSHDKDAYLYKGLLLEKNYDYSGAFQAFIEGARLFQSECLYKVGMYLYYGIGVELDQKEAYRYLKYAYYCLHGDSAYQLSMMYFDGIVVKRNNQKAIDLLMQGAQLYSMDACLILAKFYQMGQYVDKNERLSMQYYQKANEINDYTNQAILSKMKE